jgi:flavin-binding protein dodecin
MSNTYKMVTVVGTSTDSYEAAIKNALSDAATTVRNLSWFEVQEQRGRIVDGKVAEYQIKLQIGFRVEVP